MFKFLRIVFNGIKTVFKFIFRVLGFIYRLVRKFLLILILLATIVSVTLHFYLDSFVKEQIQLSLDNIPNITATIGDVSVSFFPPNVQINDIKVKNGIENDIWKQVTIQRVRVNTTFKSFASLEDHVLEIDNVTVIEPEILCDVSKIDLSSYIGNSGGNGLKEGAKDIKKGFFGGLKKIFKGEILEGTLGGLGNIFKGTLGIGKTLLNPGSLFKKNKKKDKNGKEVSDSDEPIMLVIENVYIKQGTFVPEQDLLWIKGGEKISFPDITLKNVTNKSANAVMANVEKVVVSAVTAVLLDLQKKHLFK